MNKGSKVESGNGFTLDSTVSFSGITPEISAELKSLGIENSLLNVIADMTVPGKSGIAFRIILKMARSLRGENT